MGKVRTGHSTSLDGFIAGPNDGPEAPMGHGGERLLGWYSQATPNTQAAWYRDGVQGLGTDRRATSRDPQNDRSVGDGTQDIRPHPWVGWQTPLGRTGLCC